MKRKQTEQTEEKVTAPEKKGGSGWKIPTSVIASRTINPIRNIVDKIVKPKGTPEKPLITLALGDPTIFGNLDTHDFVNAAVCDALICKRNNSYGPSTGLVSAREAIAKRYQVERFPVTADDVIIASGGSGAITLAIQALANPGDNFLIPRPGFSLYATVAGHSEIEYRYYDLKPEKQWECDLKHAETQIDEKTRFILVNNPSNPTGSNYSKEHLLEILKFAEKHKLPIVSDEIYADMVFGDQKFYSLSALSEEVPVLVISGLAKQFAVPGWRVGWVIIHDRNHIFGEKVKEALSQLSQLILGANTVMQAAIPAIYERVPQTYYQRYNRTLETHAKFLVRKLTPIQGLKLVIPQGAMYFMVEVETKEFNDIKDDQDFAQKLLTEELVFVLPGACFQAPNFFRVVTCAPQKQLADACERIAAFCARHRKQK